MDFLLGPGCLQAGPAHAERHSRIVQGGNQRKTDIHSAVIHFLGVGNKKPVPGTNLLPSPSHFDLQFVPPGLGILIQVIAQHVVSGGIISRLLKRHVQIVSVIESFASRHVGETDHGIASSFEDGFFDGSQALDLTHIGSREKDHQAAGIDGIDRNASIVEHLQCALVQRLQGFQVIRDPDLGVVGQGSHLATVRHRAIHASACDAGAALGECMGQHNRPAYGV